MVDQQKTFITKEGLKKIEEELFELKTVKRKEIADRIREAKELGDLSENAEYTEAKDEQAITETRILDLEQKIKNAQVITHKKNKHIVQVGSTVTVIGTLKTEATYTLVGSSEANPSKNFISNESPLGKAFLGKKTGDTAVVQTPRGEMSYQIKSIE
ncbi:MAG TPA: transcription elongation factor GreA [Patescibacteria group bacterium]|nr:transcription elongation factor GreA [Patescibacteria group bacterium]